MRGREKSFLGLWEAGEIGKKKNIAFYFSIEKAQRSGSQLKGPGTGVRR